MSYQNHLLGTKMLLCCCETGLWNFFLAYYIGKVKIPDIRGLNIMCWISEIQTGNEVLRIE